MGRLGAGAPAAGGAMSGAGDEGRWSRRAVLGGAAALAAGCGGGGGGPAARTQRHVRWRMASSFPRALDTIFGAAEVLAAQVAAMSGGTFEIRVYPAGELVPALQVLDAVQSGTCQAGQSGSYYYIGKDPTLGFDTCVPFGLGPRQQTAWLTEGGGAEALAPHFAAFGVRAFVGGNTGAQMGGWFKRELGGLSDLAGLKMRIPGLGGRVMSALGVSVQNIAGGDIFPALERGAIDATEWVGPHDDEQLGFHKAAPYYYYPGWWEPGPSLSFYVGEQAWAALSAEHQAIFTAACAVAARTMQARYDQRNPAALARLVAAGVQLRPFPADVMAAAQAASAQLLAEDAAKDAKFAAVLNHWQAFRTASAAWFGTAELAYAQAVRGSG